MSSNTLSHRRGLLSRPGVCTPPPPPPPTTGLYVYTLNYFDADPATPILWLWLTASTPTAPATYPADWTHDTNQTFGAMSHQPYPPDKFLVRIEQANADPIWWIHSLLNSGPLAPTLASFFFPPP